MKNKLLIPLFVFLNLHAFAQTSFGATNKDSLQNVISNLKQFIPEYIKDQNVPGASIAMVHNNEMVWAEGFGYANRITKKKVDTNSQFEIASISKVITAYIALRLLDEGILSVDRPLLSYLSEEWMPPSIYQDSIKLGHVLSHSSGLRKTSRKLLFKPGTAYFYSANGFNLLRDVMEEVTGKNLEELAQEYVFQPLSMANSSFIKQKDQLKKMSNGHIRAIAPTLLFGVLFLVAYVIIGLFGLITNRWIPKSWNLRRIHQIIFVALSLVIVSGFLFIFLWPNGLGEFAFITLFVGIPVLALFLSLFHLLSFLISKMIQNKVLQIMLNVIGALLIIGLILFSSSSITNLPIPKWPNYKASPAGTVRTSPRELALFMMEIANPTLLKPETSQLLRTPQIQLDEGLSWGMGPGIYDSENGYALWQWGQHVDFQSIMIVYPEKKSGVIVCTNNDLLNPDVAFQIAQFALREELNAIRSAIHLQYDYRGE